MVNAGAIVCTSLIKVKANHPPPPHVVFLSRMCVNYSEALAWGFFLCLYRADKMGVNINIAADKTEQSPNQLCLETASLTVLHVLSCCGPLNLEFSVIISYLWLLPQLSLFLSHWQSPLPDVLLWWSKTCVNPSWRHLAAPAHTLLLSPLKITCRRTHSGHSRLRERDRKWDKNSPVTGPRHHRSDVSLSELQQREDRLRWQERTARHPAGTHDKRKIKCAFNARLVFTATHFYGG